MMHPQRSSRIDLGELKALLVKKLGPEKSRRYFYNLNRFLSQKLSKNDFNKLCFRVLGRENLTLHNELIQSILRNAYQAKTPPPIHASGCQKSAIQVGNSSPSMEDGQELSGSPVPSQQQNVSVWPNGLIPKSPRKGRSMIRDRKHRDRSSLLGLNGKVECFPHHSVDTKDFAGKSNMENGNFIPCDYQRPVQRLQAVAEQPDDERQGSVVRPTDKPRKVGESQNEVPINNGEEMELFNHLNFFRSPLLAPLGIPYCSASVGGARKATSVIGTSDSLRCHDIGKLSGTEMLRERMEQIAVAQGLEGVSMECANMLNSMLDKYLKQLIRSCMELVGVRTAHDLRNIPAQNHQVQSKLINGMRLGNHLHIQSGSGSMYAIPEQKLRRSISMLDFRVAMELNPQQLGDDWPLLLEKICMQPCEE